MTERYYRIGQKYRDAGNKSDDDQFMRWVNLPKSGIPNSGGIRPVSHLAKPSFTKLPGVIILVTSHPTTDLHNPWDDLVDSRAGRIEYWGDAKAKHDGPDQPKGNQALRAVWDAALEQRFAELPPILHFVKPEKGWVQFSGLCVFEDLSLAWFEDRGKPVRNYRATLRILDAPKVAVEWLRQRRQESTIAKADELAPEAWRTYTSGGQPPYLKVWAARIRSKADQIPEPGTREAALLDELRKLDPFEFERVVVALFAQFSAIEHRIERTQNQNDRGFDFFGTFALPQPLQYEVPFRGEVKKYAASNAVNPKEVSRLVARLRRGEYGIYVTTSYFTKQAQDEVLEHEYPVALVDGGQVAAMMIEMGVVQGDSIRPSWLTSVLSVDRR